MQQDRSLSIRVALGLLLVASLGACATPYGSSGIAGGYREKRLNDHLVKVDFYGNGFITAEEIQTFALYRCAEVARDAKKPYFVVYDSLTAAARDLPAALPRVGTLGNKPVAFGFIALEDRDRPGALRTAAVLSELAPKVRSPAPSEIKP